MKKNVNKNGSRLKRNILTIAILIATVLMVVYVVRHIYFDASFNAFLSEDSKTIHSMEQIAIRFGDASTLMLLIDLDQNDVSSSLSQVHLLVDEIEKLSFVNGVDSVFDAQKVLGFTFSAPFIRTGPYVKEEAGNFTIDSSILEDSFYVGSLISRDGSTLAITIRKKADYQADTLDLVSTLFETIDANTSLPYHLVGEDVVNYELFASIQNFTFVYPPIIIFAVFGIFMVKFRNLYLSFLTLVPPIIASVWILFLLLVLGRNINVLTVLIPSFLIIIGSAYGMHFLSRFMEQDYEGNKKTALIRGTSQEERTPIFFSAFTTMAGFFSYVFLNMRAFRDMGLFIAIGIFFCALFTMTVIPSLLYFSKNTQKHFQKHKKYQLTIPKWLSFSFILFTIIGIIAAPFMIKKIPLDINSYGYFKPNSTLIKGVRHLDEKFNWVSNFYVMAQQKNSDTFNPIPDEIRQFAEIDQRLLDIEVVTKNMSLFGLSNSMNVSPNLLLAYIRNSEAGQAYAKTFYAQNAIRFMLFANGNDSGTAQTLVDEIERILADYPDLASKYDFYTAGIPLVWLELSEAVVQNQIQSLILSFILIFLLLLLIFRKLKTSLYSAIPIGLTILFNFIFMGLLKIPLEIPTVIISGMLMGLVIDYAIHFMYWFKKTGTVSDAYSMTASPIIFNGVSLMACFVVLLSAPLMLYVNLSLLMILGIGMGVLSTLAFLPGIIERLSKKRK
ncbi:MAG TPA: MMPL family transporter [Thermotogota bacterium]|nr:MMPL family transporter [Thermotogota bacterium]HRW34984.1 MMPL family transporter [Thermotogota bacterium]